MTKTQQIRDLLTNSVGYLTNYEIGAKLGFSTNHVATMTKQLLMQGFAKREVVRMLASNLPVYGYSVNTAVTPIADKVLQTKEKVIHKKDYVIHTGEKAASKGLDALIEQLAAQVAKQVANKVKRRLMSELESMMPTPVAADPEPDVASLITRLTLPAPKVEAKAKLPVVGVIGLLPVQNGELSAEFGDVLDLRFWDDGDDKTKLRSMAHQCEVVFIHTRHAKHSTDEMLKSNGANIRRVTGGLGNMKDALTAYFVAL